MAFYSINPRARVGHSTRPVAAGPNLYEPGTPRYAERNRQTETKLPGGLLRVDLGEPLARLPSEGLRTKTAPTSSPVVVAPAAPAEPLKAPEVPRVVASPRSRREPWGLNRDEA